MRYLVGNSSGPLVVNGGPSPAAATPALVMSGLVFSNAINLASGFAAPDQITIMCPYTITGAIPPNGSFFLQGSLSVFGGTTNTSQGIPGPLDWVTLPNTPVPTTLIGQTINNASLPAQPASFRMGGSFAPLPGFLFLRVGYAPLISSGVTDTFSVYAIAIANIVAGTN